MECYAQKTATFMILGDVCTRSCRFCSVTKGRPRPVDPQEPQRVAAAARRMELEHVVITCVTRDDLPDGGAARPGPVDGVRHHTNGTVGEATRGLARRDPTAPFFLVVSFLAPHPPLVPPAFYLDRYLRLDLPDPVARLLAERLAATVPELRGALSRLQMSAELDGGVIDQRRVGEYLAERAASRAPTLEQIAAAAARHFSLKVSQLRSASRARAVVAARSVAMYLARSLTANSLEQIGRYFGGRDHTTVSHGCRKIQESFQSEPAVRQAVLLLREKLERP